MADRPAKAEGMGWISSYITVKDVKKSLEFYKKAFDLETRMTMPDKDGKIIHAEMGYKDCIIMVGSECEESNSKAPSTLKGTPFGFYIYVEDVDKQFEKAKNAGAKVLQEPTTQFWGDRICSVACPEGHHWSFATNVADFDPSKAPK